MKFVVIPLHFRPIRAQHTLNPQGRGKNIRDIEELKNTVNLLSRRVGALEDMNAIRELHSMKGSHRLWR